MAKKTTTSTPEASDDNVVRITASSSKSSKRSRAKATDTPSSATKTRVKTKLPNISGSGKKPRMPKFLAAFGGYFKGAWHELRQVRWPTRGATWSLTGAVLIYTAFFVILILLLDAAFKYLFEIILGS